MPWRRGTRSSRRGTSTSRTRCRWSPTTRRSTTSSDLGDIPLRLEKNVYLRDVATFQDDTDITYGYALVNGKKSVYLPIIKKDTGSTLTVVADVHKSMQLFRDAVPKDVKVSFEFDESPTVRGGGRERGHRGPDRRGPDRPDDPPVPPRLAERDRRRGQHPARPARVAVRALDDGQHDQHHVAGRHGAGDRHPRRRVDGDRRERPRADAAHRRTSPRRCSTAASSRPCRGCWPCSASCRCSSRRSSWATRSGRCSCR